MPIRVEGDLRERHLCDGNAIALFLNGIDASFGYDAWKRMRNASVLRVYRRNARWEWDRAFALDADEAEAGQ